MPFEMPGDQWVKTAETVILCLLYDMHGSSTG